MFPTNRLIVNLQNELEFKCESCEVKLPYNQMVAHLKKICPKQMVECPLENEGKTKKKDESPDPKKSKAV
jgi:hypothetical protein